MARKRRIEREDAIYHVLNWGNYRRTIFEIVGARKAFQKALSEATIRFDWELYGWVNRNRDRVSGSIGTFDLRQHPILWMRKGRKGLESPWPRGSIPIPNPDADPDFFGM